MKYWSIFPVWNIWCLWPFQESDGSRAFLLTICHQIWAIHGNYKVTQEFRTLCSGFFSDYTCACSQYSSFSSCMFSSLTSMSVVSRLCGHQGHLTSFHGHHCHLTSQVTSPPRSPHLKQWYGYESHLPHRITWPPSSPSLTHATKVTSSSNMATRITTLKQWHGYESHLPHRITWPPSSPDLHTYMATKVKCLIR